AVPTAPTRPVHHAFLLDGLCVPPGQAGSAESAWSTPPGWMVSGLGWSGSMLDADAADWCPPGLSKKGPEWMPPGQAKKQTDNADPEVGVVDEPKPGRGNGWIPPKGPIGDY
ncbi:MAG: hypothetical protein MUQ27_07720, partial [Acidimicrobiia bacterium]|nr:hypothetical protein [Acidimicrobiia bacterium]